MFSAHWNIKSLSVGVRTQSSCIQEMQYCKMHTDKVGNWKPAFLSFTQKKQQTSFVCEKQNCNIPVNS